MEHAATIEPPPHRPSGRSRRRLALFVVLALAAAGAAAGTGLLHGLLPDKHAAGDRQASGFAEGAARGVAPLAVRVVRPKRDPAVEVAVEQFATIEPYHRAELKTRVAGLVRAVHKDIGDPVRQGEVLVEVDVPELDREVDQKAGVVEQRKQEQRAARVSHEHAQASVAVAQAGVRQRQAELAQAEATREYRRRRLARLSEMAGRESVVANVVDEEQRDYQAAVAAAAAAQAGVEKAQADLTEKESSVKAALVDIDLKGTLVEVARADLERSRAAAGYARVTAPFDGVVVRRNVDPGAFVQNATSGQSEALLTVARTDLLTAVARFPDNAAPYIDPDTVAAVRLNELPGVEVAGPVTRFSPSIQNSDRTVRVELDLYAGPPGDYDRAASSGGKSAVPPVRVAARGRVLAGMTGVMRLRLSRFDNDYVVPSTAVYNRSGQSYVLLIDGGRTRQHPVRVLVNDGTVAKISLTTPTGSRELTGDEQLVAARQLEVGDGTPVAPTPVEW